MPSTRGRQVVVPLVNKSGGSLAAGDVVIVDTGNDTAMTTTTSARSETSLGVVQETIASNATGRVLVAGYAALVNVPASVTRGHYVETHTVAKQATGSATRRSGSFGQFLTGGTTPTAVLWGQSDQTASGGGITHTYIGYNTIGGTALTPVANTWYMTKVTLAAAGFITSIGVYCYESGASSQVAATPAVGIWADTAGSPTQFIAVGGAGEVADKMFPANDTTPTSADGRWLHVPIGYYAAAADYWLAVGFIDVGSLKIVKDGSGSDKTLLSTGAWYLDADYPTATLTGTSDKYSIRASKLT